MTTFFDHFRRQGNIACDHEVAGPKSFHYLIVSDIKTGFHSKHLNEARRGYTHRLIGYQRHVYAGTLGRPEQDIFYHHGASIGVYPYFHTMLLLLKD